VAYYLKQNVKNYESFTIALKAIKMWAKNRGVYSQIFCYLGGIGYTILLAKICQLYPNYSPLKLLERFFYIYSRWFWEIPVNLENIPDMDDNKPN
jgi:poly(A) polymerase